jgi:hypothetical protein
MGLKVGPGDRAREEVDLVGGLGVAAAEPALKQDPKGEQGNGE